MRRGFLFDVVICPRAAAEEVAAKWIEGKTGVKAICVPGKLVNLVVR